MHARKVKTTHSFTMWLKGACRVVKNKCKIYYHTSQGRVPCRGWSGKDFAQRGAWAGGILGAGDVLCFDLDGGDTDVGCTMLCDRSAMFSAVFCMCVITHNKPFFKSRTDDFIMETSCFLCHWSPSLMPTPRMKPL